MKCTYLYLFSAFIVLFSCKKDKDTTLPGIDHIVFRLAQIPDSTGSQLQLFGYGGGFPYTNMKINYGLSITSEIRIEFTGHACENNNCIPSGGTNYAASCAILLGQLTDGTVNSFTVFKGKEYTGRVIVTDSTFKVEFDAAPVFSFLENKSYMQRIPANAVWGAVIENDTNAYYRLFIDSLLNAGAVENDLDAGYYSAFEINIDSTYSLYQFASADTTFIYTFPGTFTQLRSISDHFVNTYGLQLYLYDGKGNLY